jgi:hypothetical protein
MANIRMSLTNAALSPFAIPGAGRSYACAVGSYVDVPDFDAAILASLGWVRLSPKGANVGPTSGRPVGAPIDTVYTDTTISAVVVSDGNGNWLNALTGAAS